MAKSTIDYRRETANIWYPNQKEPLYDPSNPVLHQVFKDYWKEERRRCIEGITLADGQVKISGWLYWHTVYWKIKMKKKVKNRSFPVVETPMLRDIDWEASENFERALDEGAFIELVGSRGFGKSVWQSSMAGRYFSLIDKSQVVVSAGNGPDVKVVTDLINQGLMMLHPMFKKQWLKKDWKVEILAGFKEPDGTPSDRSSLSQIIMRNFQDGNHSMAINGTRPDFHIIDEIGKIKNFIKCVRDSDGAYWANTEEVDDSDEVQRPTCLAFYTGTGGDMDVGKDAAEMFWKPRANNLLAFPDKYNDNNGEDHGWFMPVTKARMEYKEPKTLAEYLGIDHPDLQRITILVSNEERCMKEWWLPRYEKAKATGNSTAVTSFLAYWPIKPSHSFIVLKKNNFNTEAAKEQQTRLRKQGLLGTPVELYHDGEKLCHRFTDKLPITEFPVRTQSKDAPVMIYEFPIENPPYSLYVGGVDPYRQGKAAFSESLGAVYILKRMHSIAGEKYQNMIVASYVARPDNPDKWNEQARLLIKMYNARTLVENDEQSFITYMKNKGDAALYLEPQPNWLKEISPHSDVKRDYGIHRASDRVRNFLYGCVERYLNETLLQEKDEQGSIIREVLGVQRIPDPMFLQEIIDFNEDGNFDRVVAASLAFAMAEALDGMIGKVSSNEKDPRIQALYNKNKQPSSKLFGDTPAAVPVGTRRPSKSKLFM